MGAMSRVSVIVPARNASATLPRTLEALAAQDLDEPYEVVVVDDGSTDGTATAAAAAGATVISHPFNLGIGGAVQSGYLYALERGYDVAVQVDGDGQHDARHINELLGHLRDNSSLNMVTGSRFIERTDGGYLSSASRRMGIRLFATILSRITGRRITDPTSGFRMVDRRGIELFARDYPHDYPEVEAVLLLHFHKLEGTEVPVRMRARMSGVSSINAHRSAYYMIKVTLAILVGLLRARPAVEAGDTAAVAAEHSL